MKNLKYILAVLLIIIPSKVSALNGYTIESYDVDIVVSEDNIYDITETITTNFEYEKHGIIRNIPIENEVKRLDGTTTKNRAKISNLKVSDKYSTSKSNGNYSIKIGDANKTITGEHIYIIKYTYNVGKDPLEDIDEFYFNIIGDSWDTTISDITFRIEMPDDFDEEKLGFSSGGYGSIDNDNVYYKVDDNVIEGYYLGNLDEYEALTIRLELDEGYFVNQKPSLLVVLMYAIPMIGALISLFLWFKYGRDNQVIETVEFYPPENFNSLDVAFAYNGKATNEDIVSLLIYLANKGYIEILEADKKTAFSNSKSFIINKLKDYDGDNYNERVFLEGLFHGKRTSVNELQLKNRFYKTINEISNNINSKENKDQIFEKVSKRKSIYVAIFLILSIISIGTFPLIENGDLEIAIMTFALILFYIPFYAVGFSTIMPNAIRIFWLVFTILHSSVFFLSMPILSTISSKPIYKMGFILGILCIIIIGILFKLMPKRTPYGNELLGKIKGFKNFLETAEKEKLEAMVNENPTYFYDILSFTYVLGISDKWIKKFEDIAIQEPTWYSGSSFNSNQFNTFINNTMASATKTMTSSPSSSSSRGFSSGGSSGGGSSGGGSGGGGGSSW